MSKSIYVECPYCGWENRFVLVPNRAELVRQINEVELNLETATNCQLWALSKGIELFLEHEEPDTITIREGERNVPALEALAEDQT